MVKQSNENPANSHTIRGEFIKKFELG